MAKKAQIVFHYMIPRTKTRVVNLPHDWNEYTKAEKDEFYRDECPVPDWELDRFEAVEH